MMANQNEVTVTSRHLRAICEEVGYRLRLHLDGSSSAPSPKLKSLLLRFEQSEQMTWSPSIVPSIEDGECSQAPTYQELAAW
jgi:hypothetical protein